MNSIFVEIEKCLGCKSCELVCVVKHSSARSLYLLGGSSALECSPVSAVDKPLSPRINVEDTGVGPFPLRCRHCETPPCVDACITGAIQHDKSKGIVYSDETRCIGCFMCVMVCPFGAIIPIKEEQLAFKCDLCKDEDEPACVDACPTGALVYCEPNDLAWNKKVQRAKNAKK